MRGFFTQKETESLSVSGGKFHSCVSCGLYKNCQNPKQKAYGNFKKGIMILGEYPEEIDDERNKPFQSTAGRLLKRILKRNGIDLFEDCVSLNAVNCSPGRKLPTPAQIDHCRSVIVWGEVMKYQPKIIICLGTFALQSLIGHRWDSGYSISQFRGTAIPDQDIKSWICPTYNPQYLEKIEKPKDYMKLWFHDIEQALKKLDEPFPKYKKPKIEYVDNLSFLKDYPKIMSAFDYETTGIKPHQKGHRIISCAIAKSPDHVYSFLLPRKKSEINLLRRWLYDPEIPKIAQNIKFEDIWSKVRLKVTVRGWEWDTMLASYILNNRPGTNGLKFQTYINFGIIDYSSDVDKYLKTTNETDSDNDFNNIKKLIKTKSGIKSLLKYNAYDSINEYRLALLQMEKLNWDFLPF